MKQYFLPKAHKARPDLIRSGMQWSIKLDGIRAFWDGGVSRGRTDAPWAPGVLSTGLWSNNAKPFYAPDWWLDGMPNYCADGELWAGPGKFQLVSSVVRRKVPDARWQLIRFMDHSPVTPEAFCQPRAIDTNHCQIIIDPACVDYFHIPTTQSCETASAVYSILPWHDTPKENVWAELHTLLDDLISDGHEGIMLRERNARWVPERSWELLKLKPWHDAEVRVVGVVAGRETDKGSRLLGQMGALECRWRNGRIFRVSGFSDVERELESSLTDVDAYNTAASMPGESLPSYIHAKHFPLGSLITIKYRELTAGLGVPKEARYYRKYREL